MSRRDIRICSIAAHCYIDDLERELMIAHSDGQYIPLVIVAPEICEINARSWEPPIVAVRNKKFHEELNNKFLKRRRR